ncbi:MAG: energy-coupling factor transporter transmembrane component T, partial [Liquorilactobacillus hordei]|uniref:energy-coupling factor transporter transmembrane component T family protein n=1 Tax=Liquorilactobacillus hordei TaxID=468911 RepID=UPI0039ECE8CA
MAKNLFVGYNERDTFLHHLSGSTKLIGFVSLSIIGMLTFDTRFLLVIFVFSMILFWKSEIKFSEISFILKVIIGFAVFNIFLVYVFSPGYGISIYGSHHMIFGNPKQFFNLSWEELLYLFNLILKYTFAVPLALIFLLTTEPSEFAASLNKVGVSYRISYSVEITLRYIPDIQRDYRTISLAQQARGYEISKKASLIKRARGAIQIILPLIFTSLDRIETVSQAMSLRRFGRHNKRTWYMARKFKMADYMAFLLILLIVIIGILL